MVAERKLQINPASGRVLAANDDSPPMMNRLRLLDAFCGAGGAAMGYHRAGFEVIGVDISPQPRYPFEFYQGDALDFIRQYGKAFDAIHASPPCQQFSAYRRRGSGVGDNYPNLIPIVREILINTQLPYVIENIPQAPLVSPTQLCGSSFGLNVRRHRNFESNICIEPNPCKHGWQTPRFTPASNRANLRCTVEIGVYRIPIKIQQQAMGIDWMRLTELSQSIPPAYAEYVGRFLMKSILRQSADNAQLHPDVWVSAHYRA